jgi:hypothetical protein
MCSSCKNTIQVSLLGDSFIFSQSCINRFNSSFVFNRTTSKKIYYLLDKKAVSIDENCSIISLIKKSKKILVSYGVYDVINMFDFSDSRNININVIENKLELFDYYSCHIFEILEEEALGEIYIIEQINPFINENKDNEQFNDCLNIVNQILKEYSSVCNFNFIELNNYKEYLVDDFVLSESYLNTIYDKL